MKPYPQYKDSGVSWLGKVPEDWDIKPGLSVFKEKQVKNIGLVEKRVLSLSYGKIIVKPEEKLRGLLPASFETHQIVEPGDIVIRSTDMQNDHKSLRTGLVKDKGIITSAYICLKPLCSDFSNFTHWQLHGLDLMKVLYGLGSGLRQNLSWNDFKRLPLPIPPLDEQRQISRYLDWQTSKINKFIKAKKKLIALLKEQRQNIINEAVTKGIKPNVKMKDSGVKWLGKIPEHWDIIRVGNIIDLVTGFPFPSADFSQNKEDTKLLRGINVTPSGIRWDSAVYWKRTIDDGLGSFELQEGDIVLGMDRPIISSGIRVSKIGPNDSQSLLLQRVARLRPNSNVINDFLLLLISSQMFADYIAPIFTGIGVPHLSPDQICKYKIALPPVDEQGLIINHIEEETFLIDKTINRAEREIELIQEYRTRLVSDVVTGKIDVRSIEIPDFEPIETDWEVPDEEESEGELIAEDIEE